MRALTLCLALTSTLLASLAAPAAAAPVCATMALRSAARAEGGPAAVERPPVGTFIDSTTLPIRVHTLDGVPPEARQSGRP